MKLTRTELKELIRQSMKEIDFKDQAAFDKYNKKHKMRKSTKVNVGGKDTTAGDASKKDDGGFDVGGPSYPNVPKGAKTSKQAKAMSKEKPSGYDEYEEDNDGNYKYTGNDPKLKSLYKAYASVSGDDLDFGGSKSWSNAPISKQDYRKSAMEKFTEKQAKKIYAGLDAVRNDAHDTASASDSDEDWHRYYATDRIADDWSRIMNSQGGEYKQEESITSQLKREFKQYNKINKNLTRG